MSQRRAVALTSFIVIILAFAAPAGAYWVDNGVVVCGAAGEQSTVAVVEDGGGGGIVVWRDYSGIDPALWAQKVNGRGEAQWPGNGVAIEVFSSAAGEIRCISDGAGGIYFVHSLGFDMIYVGRLESNGVDGWLRNAASGAAPSTSFPDIAPDGAGGVIVCWSDNRNGNYDIFAQRYDEDGDRLWGSGGLPVCIETNYQTKPRITSLGSDAVLFWSDNRNPTAPDLYAQKIDTTGTRQWALNGVAVCAEAGDQADHQVVTENSGMAVVVWRDTRSGNSDIYAQAVSTFGALQWTAGGVPVCATTVMQSDPRLIAFGPGGVVIVWEDYSGKGPDWDIHAQRLEVHGVPQWGTNGRAVCSTAGDQYGPRIIEADSERAIISWNDRRNVSGDPDIYAQQIDGDVDPLWILNGIAVTGLGGQDGVRLATDGAGGAIVAWSDQRVPDEDDIRAQRIFQDGRTGDPRPSMRAVGDIADDEGGYARIELRASDRDLPGIPFPAITLYNVWRKIESFAALAWPGAPGPEPRPRGELLAMAADADLAADLRLGPAEAAALGLPPGSWESAGLHPAMQQGVYYFIVPTRQDSSQSGTHWETFAVSAHTSDPGLYFVSFPDSGYSVDNLAPASPLGLAGEQTYEPAGLRLTWDPNTEDDLWYYGVHRGTDAGFEPEPGNLVATPVSGEWFDGGWSWEAGYWYKVSAVDRHGNGSLFAVLGPAEVTGDEPVPVPDATFLAQNVPNPFNPSTTIAFGLKERSRVSLRIYDAAGRLVATLLDGTRPTGRYSIEWDGRGPDGMNAASGVYFYRLRAGTFEETRKMILLR